MPNQRSMANLNLIAIEPAAIHAQLLINLMMALLMLFSLELLLQKNALASSI